MIISCNNKKEHEFILVDLNETYSIKYSDIFYDLQIVQLDDGVLVGDIDDLIVLHNRVVILDRRISNAVHFFDRNGRCIKSIIADDGPQVFTSPSTISLSQNGDEILVTDGMSYSIYFYDLDGKFLKKLDNRDLSVDAIDFSGDNFYVWSRNQVDWSKKLELRDLINFSVNGYIDLEKELEFKVLDGRAASIFKNSKYDNLCFTQKFHPKIIQISNSKIQSTYLFQFNSSNFDYLKGNSYRMVDLYREIKGRSLNALNGNLVAIGDHLFVDFIYSGDPYIRTFYFNKSSKKNIVLEAIINDMDMVMKNRRSLYKYPVVNEYMTYAYQPYDVQQALYEYDREDNNPYLEDIRSLNLKSDSNPVLFIYKLKEDIAISW